MIIGYSKNGVPIRLSKERQAHIERRHPEMRDQTEKIVETIADPDIVQEGDFGELLAIKFFSDTPLTEKFLVAVYREINDEEGFLITAYFTRSSSKRRKVIWRR